MGERQPNGYCTSNGQKIMDIDHKYDRKILSQNEELAKIRKEKMLDNRLEARVSKIEDDTAQMKMDIKVTSVSTHFRFPSVLHCLTQFLKKKQKMQQVQQQILQLLQSIVDPSTPTSAQGQPSMATSSQVRLSMPTSAQVRVCKCGFSCFV